MIGFVLWWQATGRDGAVSSSSVHGMLHACVRNSPAKPSAEPTGSGTPYHYTTCLVTSRAGRVEWTPLGPRNAADWQIAVVIIMLTTSRPSSGAADRLLRQCFGPLWPAQLVLGANGTALCATFEGKSEPPRLSGPSPPPAQCPSTCTSNHSNTERGPAGDTHGTAQLQPGRSPLYREQRWMMGQPPSPAPLFSLPSPLGTPYRRIESLARSVHVATPACRRGPAARSPVGRCLAHARGIAPSATLEQTAMDVLWEGGSRYLTDCLALASPLCAAVPASWAGFLPFALLGELVNVGDRKFRVLQKVRDWLGTPPRGQPAGYWRRHVHVCLHHDHACGPFSIPESARRPHETCPGAFYNSGLLRSWGKAVMPRYTW